MSNQLDMFESEYNDAQRMEASFEQGGGVEHFGVAALSTPKTSRKLATIRMISAVTAIPGADAIECAHVGGWPVVIKKGEYVPGDVVIYVEPDSWVPHDLAPFLSKGKEPRTYQGIRGEKLRTVRLRGQISQGLILPLSVEMNGIRICTLGLEENADVSSFLGVVKWEAPIPACLAGEIRGSFPTFIPKTDQERIQNLSKELTAWAQSDELWEVTEKLEGSSMTVYFNDGVFSVCSRNLDLKPSESNTFWRTAIENELDQRLPRLGRNLAVQGELIGEGIEGNIYQLKGHRYRVYDIYDIDAGRYVGSTERQELTEKLGLDHTPVLGVGQSLRGATMSALIETADGLSKLGQTKREGVVYKRMDGTVSFKAISNAYLLGQK